MRRSHSVVVLVLCLLTGGLVSAGQLTGPSQSPPRPGVIFGQVLDADSKQTVAQAIVSVSAFGVPGPEGPVLSGATPQRVMTDAEGRFVLRDLRPGPVQLSVFANGYLSGTYGQPAPGGPGRAIVLQPDETRGPIAFEVWKPAVLEGRVVDEAGEPAVRVSATALRRVWTQGRPRFQISATVQTDDRGRFRIGGLTPGRYVVVVPLSHTAVPLSVVAEYRERTQAGGAAGQAFMREMQSNGVSFVSSGQVVGSMVVQTNSTGFESFTEGHDGVYATTFVPAVDSADTDLITLRSGEERTGIDIALTPVRPVTVSGTVLGPDGPRAMTGVRVVSRALSGLPLGTMSDVARTVTDSTGAFTLLAVPPGDYELVVEVIPRPEARSAGITVVQSSGGSAVTTMTMGAPEIGPPPKEPTLAARMALAVGNRPIEGLVVPLTEGPRVRGTVEFVGSAARPTPEQLQRLSISLRAVDGPSPLGLQPTQPDEHGAFESMGHPPGRYFVTATASAGWFLESAVVEGRDVSLEPLELESGAVENLRLTFVDQRTELRGRLTPAAGEDADGTVVVFPDDVPQWVRRGMSPRQLVVTRAGTDGQFTVTGLPPGTYHVVAVPASEVLETGNPDVLIDLSRRARTVTLVRGQTLSVDLSVGDEIAADVPADHGEPQSGPWVPDGTPDQAVPQARDATAVAVGTASISGVVTLDDEQRTPVRRAQVRLTGSAVVGAMTIAVTDSQGRFTFRDLPDGRYSLTSTRAGFVGIAAGATGPNRPGPPIALAAGQQLRDVRLTMLRGAAIEGTLRDEAGRPLERTQVQLFQFRVVNGERVLGMAMGSTLPITTTDDRGWYRLYGVAPGEYVVGASLRNVVLGGEVRQSTAAEWDWARQRVAPSATPGAAPAAAAPPPRGAAVGAAAVFYPGTTNPDAAALIQVQAGEERTGIDFVVTLVPTASVSGRIGMPDGSAPQQLQVNMISHTRVSGGLIAAPTFVRPTPDGRFTAPGLAPGRYSLVARAAEAAPGSASTPPRAGGRGGMTVPLRLWAQRDLEVSGQDITDVMLTLEPGMKVSGRIVFEGATPPPSDVARASARLGPVQTGAVTILTSGTTPTADDGTFVIEGNVPGAYRLMVTAPWRNGTMPVWAVDRIMLGGVDVADGAIEVVPGRDIENLEVVMTDRITEVSGTITDGLGRPASEYAIVIFPANPAHRAQGSRRTPPMQRPDTAGRFRVPALPPGEYYIAAITEPEPGQAFDAAFYESLVASAVKFTLAPGERKVQDLRLAGG